MSNFYMGEYLLKLSAMKFVLLGAFVFFFVGLPVYLLNNLVLPDLGGLEQSYSHQGQTVQALFPQPQNGQNVIAASSGDGSASH